MSEENYEPSERLKKWIAESQITKKLSLQFETFKRLADKHKEIVPIIDLENARMNVILNEIKESKKENLEVRRSIENDSNNPIPHIFIDHKAYQFFELLHSNYKESKYILADYSFIYRMMYKEKLILNTFKPEMFREWIAKEPYSKDTLDKIKTLDKCSTNEKNSMYNILKSRVYD